LEALKIATPRRTYSELWHFSPLTLTLIYATYAFGVLATLLLAGGVSDEVGRRPVLLAALAGLMGASLLYLFADSAAWLFAARGLQGLATGAALSAASASLLDLHPRRDPAGVALANATATAGGLGLGMLVSSSLVQIGWHPRLLPYLVLLALITTAFVGAYLIPEPVRTRGRFRLTVQRPRVPAVVRRPFLLAALAVLSSWSIGALFFSLGPALAAHLFHTSNAISAPWLAASTGSIALAAGTALIVVAAATDSSPTYLAGSILGGIGFGAAFFGALRALVAKIPDQHRAAVMAAFYVVAYGSLSVPAVLAGVVVTHISLQSTFEIFGSVVAAIGLVVAFEAWRQRPGSHRHSTEPKEAQLEQAS